MRTLNSMNSEQIEAEFKELFSTNRKLESVKMFKDFTGLGLREAKEFIDNTWSDSLGISVRLYLLKNKGYIAKSEIAKGNINLQIEVARDINESQIDDLIEEITKQIAKQKT
jgi:hypothetical protein